MRTTTWTPAADSGFDRLGRFSVAVLATLLLCSCRGPAPPAQQVSHPFAAHGGPQSGFVPGNALAQASSGAPQAEYSELAEYGATPSAHEVPSVGHGVTPVGYDAPPSGHHAPPAGYAGAPYPVESLPLPYRPEGPWAPPGIARPWPADEYMFDGGDREEPTRVGQQWQVYGLHTEDTVAHFDTLDGRTLVEPSNRVQIYAPRFGAVRQVVGLAGDTQAYGPAGVAQPQQLSGPTIVERVDTGTQNRQAIGQRGLKLVGQYGSRQGDGVVSEAQGPVAFQDQLLPYENLDIIRRGVMEASEMAWLAQGVQAAKAWTTTQAVQVVLDHQAANAEVQTEALQDVFTVKTPKGNPRLRVIKVASEHFAKPGDEIAFTIRFDNVGNQVIGNVTILDNLTTRLEYIADSAQCSLDANFFTEPNEGGSVVLRTELVEPLSPGMGGVLRFRCRVR